jgi:hypothetical protein
MDTRTLKLFLLTYEAGEEIKQRPIYAITSELAVNTSIDWFIEHEDSTYLSVQEAPEEGASIDGTFYPATKEVSQNGC